MQAHVGGGIHGDVDQVRARMAYRGGQRQVQARAVADPRGVLKEFGTELPDDTQINVWDSTAEMRYLILPERPADTDDWSAEDLALLVSRNAMIGTEKARLPKEARQK